jgi:hypothetical protein
LWSRTAATEEGWIMMRVVFLLLLIPCLTFAAQADETEPYIPLDDESYVVDYFGTQLIVFMTERMIADDTEWWPDKLPEDLLYDQPAMIELVNAQRAETGTPLLDPEGWYIESGWEEETDGGWQYDISFYGMRPSEVMLLLTEFGGADTLFPGGQFSYLPCMRRMFNSRIAGLNQDYVFVLAEQEYRFDPHKGIDELHTDVKQAFAEAYGQDVSVDLSVYGYMEDGGDLDLEMMASAELPPE